MENSQRQNTFNYISWSTDDGYIYTSSFCHEVTYPMGWGIRVYSGLRP